MSIKLPLFDRGDCVALKVRLRTESLAVLIILPCALSSSAFSIIGWLHRASVVNKWRVASAGTWSCGCRRGRVQGVYIQCPPKPSRHRDPLGTRTLPTQKTPCLYTAKEPAFEWLGRTPQGVE